MFVIPGIVAMLAYVYIHPQEVFEPLRAVTFPMLLAFTGLGYLLDVRVGASGARRPSLLLLLAIAFFGWAVLTIAIVAPDTVMEHLQFFVVSMGLFFATSIGVSTLRGFRIVTITLLSITVLLATVGIQQGMTPTVCLLAENSKATAVEGQSAEGRPCVARIDCYDNSGLDRDYECEHLGLMNTNSIGGRVRYRGIFQDPNELAWSLSLSLPFIFLWFERRRIQGVRVADRVIVGLVLVACMVCNVMTRSRSGQLSMLATLAVYFIHRFGWRGIAFGAALAAPILVFGGRSDESSTQERLECWAEAIGLWREHPLMGVGARQFGQHHYLTAHNSALLTLAEMGPIGLVLFTGVIYVAFKISMRAQRALADRPEATEARAAALATSAALVGMAVSAFFLSLSYHVALWVTLGLAGAVQALVLRHDPDWRVNWGWRDAAFVVGLDAALVIGIAGYLRTKGL